MKPGHLVTSSPNKRLETDAQKDARGSGARRWTVWAHCHPACADAAEPRSAAEPVRRLRERHVPGSRLAQPAAGVSRALDLEAVLLGGRHDAHYHLDRTVRLHCAPAQRERLGLEIRREFS